MNPREAAFVALLNSSRGEGYISEFLEQWRQKEKPQSNDFNFAQRIAVGTMQMALTLDYLLLQVGENKKLSLKLKERLLLRLALYQFYFLERVPLYAIANEMIKVAKKYCHETFVRFFNVLLRKLSTCPLALPEGNSSEKLSIQYSYPEFFIKQLIAFYGLDQTKTILTLGNEKPLIMMRERKAKEKTTLLQIASEPFPFYRIEDPSQLVHLAQSDQFYIQNITPAYLLGALKSPSFKPKTILDLCASPGGKLLAAHDLFSHAQLYANDVTPEKIKRLQQNIDKYHLQVSVSCHLGENYPLNKHFDLIILDVPCSNTGVLNKRPEARWRLSEENLQALQSKQMELLSHATNLLNENGEIWYMTCSILPTENEHLVKQACQKLHLKMEKQLLILPNVEGWDGGFACSLKKI